MRRQSKLESHSPKIQSNEAVKLIWKIHQMGNNILEVAQVKVNLFLKEERGEDKKKKEVTFYVITTKDLFYYFVCV